jgi:hypothetical protein
MDIIKFRKVARSYDCPLNYNQVRITRAGDSSVPIMIHSLLYPFLVHETQVLSSHHSNYSSLPAH